ncbi:NUDIX domain-containing protein [Modestobacter roseus]|uniref:NUDIX domain-containing protein n=1 Tax=Modestobacter roseus TaxID=1181884 RepID=UPI001AA0C99E|nr:NUDIX domain-containing protein [Modestobacter roseus]
MHHVVTGALVRPGCVLLTHRSPDRRWYPDVWDLPGGHVDDGETELQALRRELREELAVEAQGIDPAPLARVEDPAADLRLGLWVVRDWVGTPVNACPDEHDEIRWVGAGELPHLALAHPQYRPAAEHPARSVTVPGAEDEGARRRQPAAGPAPWSSRHVATLPSQPVCRTDSAERLDQVHDLQPRVQLFPPVFDVPASPVQPEVGLAP